MFVRKSTYNAAMERMQADLRSLRHEKDDVDVQLGKVYNKLAIKESTLEQAASLLDELANARIPTKALRERATALSELLKLK